jgi:OOP family OmpA-OmpF porin
MKRTLIALSIFAMTPVIAQTSQSYLALDLGSAAYSGVTVAAGTYPNPGTFSVAYGYRMTDTGAVELGFTGFGDSILSGVGVSATTTASSINAKYVATLPLSEQFSLVGNAGLGFNKNQITATAGSSSATVSDSATSFIFGLGVKFKINQRFALRAQYENYGSFGKFGTTGNNMTVTTFTIGGNINF